MGKKSGKGLFDWSRGRPEIDLSKATDKVDPIDLMAVNATEATKIVAQGVCELADVDRSIIYATGVLSGPIAMIKDIEPAELTAKLEKLASTFHKEIFKPSKMVRDGGYR